MGESNGGTTSLVAMTKEMNYHKYRFAMGFPAVLIKGGHFDEDLAASDDHLFTAAGHHALPGARLALPPGGVHGTGCALSTAIACRLALGDELAAACTSAKAFVATRLASPFVGGRGRPSVT